MNAQVDVYFVGEIKTDELELKLVKRSIFEFDDEVFRLFCKN
jgi:hypothetical protein